MKKLIYTLVILALTVSLNAQWVHTSAPGNSWTIGSVGNILFSSTQAEDSTNIYKSSDNGDNWTGIQLGIPSWIYAFSTSGNNLFAVSVGNGIYRTTNNGNNWNYAGLFLTQRWINDIASNGSYLYAGTDNYGLYVSSNYGANWSDPLYSDNIHSVSYGAGYVFGVQGFKIFRCTSTGGNSSTVLFNGSTFLCVRSEGSYVYVGSDSGIYRSTNSGDSWMRIPFTTYNEGVYSIAINGNNVFAGTNNGIYLSTNYGLNWLPKNQGLDSNSTVNSVYINNGYVFLTLNFNEIGKGVWRRSISEIISINNISTEVPSKYSLSQNYPNPFNPITNVKFSIINSEQVKLIVYDVQGREVQTLVNESLKPGTYETTFDGSYLASEVYFYRLTTDGFSETKKMILMK
jgi:hypothetical protein